MMIAVALLASLASGPVQDSEERPTMFAEVGYRGSAFPDSWVGVITRVQTVRKPFEGRLVVRIRGRFGDSRTYEQRVSLGAPTDRRIVCDFFATGTEAETEVELEDSRGAVVARATVPLKFYETRTRQMLVVGDTPPSLRSLPRSFDLEIAAGTSENLPHTLAPLLAFEWIVISRPVELTYGQADALKQWVELGGRLVLSGGPHGREWMSSELKDVLPVEVTGVEAVEHEGPAGGAAVAALSACRIRAGHEFLPIGGRAMGVRARRGRGEVVFLLYSLLDRGGWLPAATAWGAILGAEDRDDAERPIVATTAGFIDRLNESEMPLNLNLTALGFGAGMAVLYLLIVGPLDWFYSRRRGFARAWMRLAASVVIFSGAFIVLRGRFSPATARLVHVVIEDHADRLSLVQSFSSFQADHGRTYRVSTPPGAAMSAIPGLPSQLVAEAMPEPIVEEGPTLRLPMPALTIQAFGSLHAEEARVWCRRDPKNPGRIEVENRGRTALEGCVLVSRDTVTELGRIGAAEKRAIDLTQLSPMTFEQWIRRLLPKEDEQVRVWGLWASSWVSVKAEEWAMALSFYRKLRFIVAGERDWRGQRQPPLMLRQRLIDLSNAVDGGAVVFLGRSADAGGVSIDATPRTEVRTVVRVVVAP